jgi:hypothetical protein
MLMAAAKFQWEDPAGDKWPGFIKDVDSCIPEYLHPERFPKIMNFMDPTVLTRELNRAGFKVVTAGFYPYTGNFAPGRLDGRELTAAIGPQGMMSNRQPRSRWYCCTAHRESRASRTAYT